MKCPKCGYDNKDGADHCDLCKEILAKQPEFDQPTINRYQPSRSMEEPTGPERPIISSPSDGKIDHMEAIKFGWEAMKEHFWLFMGSIGIYGIELIIQWGSKGHNFVGFSVPLAFVYLNIVIFILGYNKVCLKIVDGEETEFSDLFSCFHLGWTFILAYIIFIIGLISIFIGLLFIFGEFALATTRNNAVIIGMITFIIAISIIMLRFIFISYLIVDKELGPMECVKGSWNMTRGTIWDMSIFFLLLSLVIIAGALCLGVGLFAAMPTVSVATAYYYRQLSKRI